jgi:chromosome segregation ATPase
MCVILHVVAKHLLSIFTKSQKDANAQERFMAQRLEEEAELRKQIATENDELHDLLNEATRQESAFERTTGQLEKQLNGYQEREMELGAELSAFQQKSQKHDEISHELAVLRHKCEEQDSTLLHQQHLVSTFENDLTEAKRSSGSLQQENHALAMEMEMARQAISEAQHEITQLRKLQQKYNSMESGSSQIRADNRRSAEKIAVLQQQLLQQRKETEVLARLCEMFSVL